MPKKQKKKLGGSRSQSSLIGNISWDSKIEKKEDKTSATTLYIILGGLFLLFLFVLWALVEDQPALLAREKAREKAEARRNASSIQSNISRKAFSFESSTVLNSTQLTDLLRQLSDPESDLDRIVMIAFDDSTRDAAMGDMLKVKSFRKMEAVAKSMPRKKFFQRYEDDELPMIGSFDCGNPNDNYAEQICKEIIQTQIPNVVIFRKNTKPRILPQEYRSDNQIVTYLHSLMQPAVVFLDERSECEDFVTNDKYLNVVLFGTDETSVFEAVADNLREFARFGKTKNPSNAEAFFTQIPSILAWRTFGENPIAFAGNLSDGQSIYTFVLNQYLPPFGEFNERTQHQYLKRGLPIIWIAFEPDEETNEKLFSVTEGIATQYQGALSFVKLDVHEQPKIAQNLGINVKGKTDREEDESAEKQEEQSELPQVLIMNQIANIRQVIDMDDIEKSIIAVINEYSQKVRANRGELQSEMETMEESGEEEAEDEDTETEDEENIDLDSQPAKEDL